MYLVISRYVHQRQLTQLLQLQCINWTQIKFLNFKNVNKYLLFGNYSLSDEPKICDFKF